MAPAKNLSPRDDEDDEARAIRAEVGALKMHLEWHGPAVTQAILRLVPPGTAERPRRLLDLGCGNGEFTRRFLERAPTDTAACLNVLEAHLELARKRLEPFGARATFILAAVEDLHAREDLGGFDLVVASSLLHFIDDEDLDRVVAAVHERLAPGGWFLATQVVAYPPAFRSAYDAARAAAYRDAQPTGELKARIEALNARRRALSPNGAPVQHDFRNVKHAPQRLHEAFARAGFAAIDEPWRLYDFLMVGGIKAAVGASGA